MPELSVESIATAGAFLALLLAAAAGVTSRRGIQLIVIGVVFSWLPFASEVASRWIAGQRGGYERNKVRRVRGTDRGQKVDWGCVGRASGTTVASGGPRSTPPDTASCR
jgi:hypothetical protein